MLPSIYAFNVAVSKYTISLQKILDIYQKIDTFVIAFNHN